MAREKISDQSTEVLDTDWLQEIKMRKARAAAKKAQAEQYKIEGISAAQKAVEADALARARTQALAAREQEAQNAANLAREAQLKREAEENAARAASEAAVLAQQEQAKQQALLDARKLEAEQFRLQQEKLAIEKEQEIARLREAAERAKIADEARQREEQILEQARIKQEQAIKEARERAEAFASQQINSNQAEVDAQRAKLEKEKQELEAQLEAEKLAAEERIAKIKAEAEEAAKMKAETEAKALQNAELERQLLEQRLKEEVSHKEIEEKAKAAAMAAAEAKIKEAEAAAKMQAAKEAEELQSTFTEKMKAEVEAAQKEKAEAEAMKQEAMKLVNDMKEKEKIALENAKAEADAIIQAATKKSEALAQEKEKEMLERAKEKIEAMKAASVHGGGQAITEEKIKELKELEQKALAKIRAEAEAIKRQNDSEIEQARAYRERIINDAKRQANEIIEDAKAQGLSGKKLAKVEKTAAQDAQKAIEEANRIAEEKIKQVVNMAKQRETDMKAEFEKNLRVAELKAMGKSHQEVNVAMEIEKVRRDVEQRQRAELERVKAEADVVKRQAEQQVREVQAREQQIIQQAQMHAQQIINDAKMQAAAAGPQRPTMPGAVSPQQIQAIKQRAEAEAQQKINKIQMDSKAQLNKLVSEAKQRETMIRAQYNKLQKEHEKANAERASEEERKKIYKQTKEKIKMLKLEADAQISKFKNQEQHAILEQQRVRGDSLAQIDASNLDDVQKLSKKEQVLASYNDGVQQIQKKSVDAIKQITDKVASKEAELWQYYKSKVSSKEDLDEEMFQQQHSKELQQAQEMLEAARAREQEAAEVAKEKAELMKQQLDQETERIKNIEREALKKAREKAERIIAAAEEASNDPERLGKIKDKAMAEAKAFAERTKENAAKKIRRVIETANKREEAIKSKYETVLDKAKKKEEHLIKMQENKARRMRRAESKSKVTPQSLLFFIGIAIIVASWFIPSSRVDAASGTIVNGDPTRIGIGWIFQAFGEAFRLNSELIIFLISIAGFMGVLLRSGALQAFMHRIIQSRKGNEVTLVPMVMIIVAVGSSTVNLSYGLIPLATIIIPFFVLAGFDVLTGLLTIMLGWATGIMGSTINPYTSGAWKDELNTFFREQQLIANLNILDGVWMRAALLAVFVAVASLVVMSYAKLVFDTPENSRSLETTKELRESKNEIIGTLVDNSITPTRLAIILITLGTLLMNIVAILPWTDFGVTAFDEFRNWTIENNFGRFFFGAMPALGSWSRANLAALFMLSSLIIGKVMGMNLRILAYSFIRGINKMTSTIIIVILGGMVIVIMDKSQVHVTLISSVFSLVENLNGYFVTILSSIIAIIFSPLFPQNTNIYPIIAQSVGSVAHGAGNKVEYITFIGTAVNTGLGVAGPILPTSVITIVILDNAQISYGRWARVIFPALVTLIVTAIVGLSVLYIFVNQ